MRKELRFLDWWRHFGGKAKAVRVFCVHLFFSDDVQTVICTTFPSPSPTHIPPSLISSAHLRTRRRRNCYALIIKIANHRCNILINQFCHKTQNTVLGVYKIG